MNIKHETGCFHSFCPLASIGWLHRKIRNSFHLVLGTDVCASFLQNAFGMMIFAKPRFATAVMEKADVYKGPSIEELKGIVKGVMAEFPVDVLFLWNSCPAEILKIDLKQWASELERSASIKIIPIKASGLDISFTDGEDLLLTALIEIAKDRPVEENLILMGSVSDTVETELSLALGKLSLPVHYFPTNNFTELPHIGRNSTVVFLQPYLSRAFNKIKSMGSRIIPAPIPFGAGATRDFIERILGHFSVNDTYADRANEIHSLNTDLERKISGKQFFFFPDTNLEIPLARFLIEMGGHISEIGTPSLDAELLSIELDKLRPHNIPIYVQPDYTKQFDRLKGLRPDMVIAPLALSNYLIEEGFRVKLSMDFIVLPLYGFSNHRFLLELFIHVLER